MNGVINRQCMLTGVVLLSVIAAMIFPVPAQGQTAAPADEWKFSITPYLWLPNINGTLKYTIPPGAQGSPEVETGPNDYLQNLQALVLLSGEVRRDRWSMFADIIYLGFEKENSTVKAIDFGGSLVSSSLNLATSSWLRGTNVTLGAGYAVRTGKASPVDVFGGLRYFDLSAGTDWQLTATVSGPTGTGQTFPASGSISTSTPLLDGIIGVKGRYRLGESRWSVPYYLDIGAGSSQLTYQWLLGIAYSFGWGDVTFAYRDLYFDQQDDKFVQDLCFSGPALGATFRF
jgi:hypothetical protein